MTRARQRQSFECARTLCLCTFAIRTNCFTHLFHNYQFMIVIFAWLRCGSVLRLPWLIQHGSHTSLLMLRTAFIIANAHLPSMCTDNVLLTSWNWLTLSDFSPFKPTFLPAANDVAVLYYFFEPAKGRSGCALAPERFVGPSTDVDRRASSVAHLGNRGVSMSVAEPATTRLQLVRLRCHTFHP